MASDRLLMAQHGCLIVQSHNHCLVMLFSNAFSNDYYVPGYLSKMGLVSVFLIESYGTPNGTGRCSVAQCYDNAWAMLVQSIIKLLPMVVALLDLLDFKALEDAY